MRLEDFPIGEKELNMFTERNTPLWRESIGDPALPPVYVNLSMVRMQAAWVLPKLLYAKGMAAELGCSVRVFTWRENPALTSFFSSFGIEHLALDTLSRRSPKALLKAVWKTLQTVFTTGSGEKLQALKLSGLPVGYSLYEDILRTSSLSTIRTGRSKTVLKKLFHLSLTFYALEKEMKSRGAAFVLCDDEAYHEGMFIRLFLSRGIPCVSQNDALERGIGLLEDGTFDRDLWNFRAYYEDILTGLGEEELIEAEKLLDARFAGKNGRRIDAGAFAGELPEKDELISRMGLEPGKKNVFIMAHTFSDGVMNSGHLYFRDYYEWLEKTLELAEGLPGVNWILKPHPTRGSYNEAADSVEAMYERHKAPHIHLFPESVAAKASAMLADATVTIGGNAGLEYACFGVPVIITGKPFYHGFGFTIEPRDMKAYEKALHGLPEITPLSEEQIDRAKKVFYLRSTMDSWCPAYFHDDFQRCIADSYYRMVDKMALSYFAGNENTLPYNTECLRDILQWMEKGDFRETEYYKRGAKRGKELLEGEKR